eukprot:5974282-Pyramimonas_sp.AAC.1
MHGKNTFQRVQPDLRRIVNDLQRREADMVRERAICGEIADVSYLEGVFLGGQNMQLRPHSEERLLATQHQHHGAAFTGVTSTRRRPERGRTYTHLKMVRVA